MTTIYRTIDIQASPSSVWEKIADTEQISNLVGFLKSSVQADDTRTCTLDGGGQLVEKIVSVDHDLKRVMYAITDSPLNMAYHASSMHVQEHEGHTRLAWTVDLLPKEAAEHFTPMLDSACADMQTTLLG